MISEQPVTKPRILKSLPKPRKHLCTYSLQEEINVTTGLDVPRKQKEPIYSKEKEVLEDTDTEEEGSDEKQHKSEIGPGPLKREKRITEKETPKSSAERPKQKHVTPEWVGPLYWWKEAGLSPGLLVLNTHQQLIGHF